MKNDNPNPWIALFINSFIPGLGYIYCGTKWLWFNVTLIVIEILRYLEITCVLSYGPRKHVKTIMTVNSNRG